MRQLNELNAEECHFRQYLSIFNIQLFSNAYTRTKTKKLLFFLFKDFSDQDEQRTKCTNEVGAWAF